MSSEGIHPTLQPLLRRFVTELENLFNKDLRCVCLFGPSVQGQFIAGTTEVNVLIVLDNYQSSNLRQLAPAVQAARREFLLEPLLFTNLDLLDSTDVFPLRILQVKRSYRLLSGIDVLKELTIQPEHIRLACEREAKSIVMRLRQLYLIQSGLRPFWREALIESVTVLFQLLRCALELSGIAIPEEEEGLLELSEREMGVDPAAIMRVFLLKFQNDRNERQNLEQIFLQYLNTVECVSRYIDRLSS